MMRTLGTPERIKGSVDLPRRTEAHPRAHCLRTTFPKNLSIRDTRFTETNRIFKRNFLVGNNFCHAP